VSLTLTAADDPSAPYILLGDSTDGDWLARRALGVGASEAAMMLGHHPKHGEGGPAILWAQKTGRQDPESLDDVEFVQWGHVMEPVIVEQYSLPRYAGRRVEKVRAQLQSTVHPWALCTLDAWTWHPKHGRIPLEVKNVGLYQADRWADHPPVEMWWQLQHQMLVTGAPMASIAACIGGNALAWEDVPRDDHAQQLLAKKGAEFWACVDEDRVPLHVPTLASVRALYPAGAESGLVQLTGETWLDLDLELQEAQATHKAAEKTIDRLKALISDAIGQHESGVLDDGTTYTNKTTTRRSYTVEEKSYRVLRRKKGKG
jgi:putative phage-type endonuclease